MRGGLNAMSLYFNKDARNLMHENEIQKYQNLSNILPSSTDLLNVAKNLTALFSVFNPFIGSVCSIALNNLESGLNAKSEAKLRERLGLLTKTILDILKDSENANKNFEASLLCPDLVRQSLVIDDIEKAKDNLKIVECLYRKNDYIIDDAYETVNIMSRLSSNEYKLLKSIPANEMKWGNFLDIAVVKSFYAEDKIRLSAYLESLNNKTLIRIFAQNILNGMNDYRLIDYNDSRQTICLSEYGKFFLTNIELIKNKV